VARLLVDGHWYESVSPGATFESDFENLLIAQAAHLYPGYHIVPFKKLVTSEFGDARADLALIDTRYRDWWVVEVELAVHSLSRHVLPQVAALSMAVYGEEEAKHLAGRSSALDLDALREMVLGAPPRVLVLVNQARPDWLPEIRRWGGLLGIVEVFRSKLNKEILRINGQHPSSEGSRLGVCRSDSLMPTSLVLESPAALPHGSTSVLDILYGDGHSSWKRVAVADRVWLMPIGRYPLPEGQRTFSLMIRDDGQLVLEDVADPALERRR
jgi:hypothetical protein